MKRTKAIKITNYWRLSTEHSLKTMNGLFSLRHYSDPLFFFSHGFEKILKYLVVEKTNLQAAITHDLLILAKLTEIEFSDDDLDFLNLVNRFNIKARYPDYRLNFYEIADFVYTKNKLDRVLIIYKYLCYQLSLRQ
jgi:HEPN domain-containing protein